MASSDFKKISTYVDELEKAGLLVTCTGETDRDVKFITYDSKKVTEGSLFVCKGIHFKSDYLYESIKRGAVVYVSEKEYECDNCTAIIVNDVRKAMTILAETYYGKLYEKLKMIGITGTKGKSTTTYFVRSILDDYMQATDGKSVAVCSTIHNYDGVSDVESRLTTPELMEVYLHMNNAINSGIKYMDMEVSSQALKYGRVDGITFDVACFLNIGDDHISPVEHKDFADYLGSKLKIFDKCVTACVNLDCESQNEIMKAAEHAEKLVTFSQFNEAANVYGYDIISDEGNVSFNAEVKGIDGAEDYDERFELATFGTINVEDALASIAISTALNVPVEYIKSGLRRAMVPGRMNVFRSEDRKHIAIVDYAHNALSFKALFNSISKEFPHKKITVVYGSPGDKAINRRQQLGELSGRLCNHTVITEEDEGDGNLKLICDEIASYIVAEGGSYEIVYDRASAIRKAIADADEDTIVIVAGKGDERRMKRKDGKFIDYPSDCDIVRESIAKK